MSRRLLQKGRYPKDNSMYQNPAPVMQEPLASTSMNYSQASEVPLYNTQPVQQFQVNQSSENNWQQDSVPSIQPGQSEMLQPHWSSDPSYTMARPPENAAWNWFADSNPQNHTNQAVLQQQQQTYNPQNHNNQVSPQTQFYDPQNHNNQISSQTQIYNPAQMVYNNAPYAIEQPQQNMANSGEYPSQSKWYPDTAKVNGNQPLQEPPWEVVAPNISQPEHLPWTYNVPQNAPLQNNEWSYSQSTEAVMTGGANWSEQSAGDWTDVSLHQNYQQHCNYVTQSHTPVVDGEARNLESNKVISENIQQGTTVENSESAARHSASMNSLYSTEMANDSGALSAFFHHSVEENIEVAAPNIIRNTLASNVEIAPLNNIEIAPLSNIEIAQLNNIDESSLNCIESASSNSTEVATLSNTEMPRFSPGNEETASDMSLASDLSVIKDVKGTEYLDDSAIIQSVNFGLNIEVPLAVEEDMNIASSVSTLSPEEPLNQEVPEPSQSFSNLSTPYSLKEIVNSESSDEPLNQQVPAESCPVPPTISKEESSFKNVKSKTTTPVVQKEVIDDIPVVRRPKHDVPGFQEVNLEALPDNLERPPDPDDSKKELSLSSAFRQHLRPQKESHLDTSKASLWDAFDSNLSCVLLPPSSISPITIQASDAVPNEAQTKHSPKSDDLAAVNSKLSNLQISEPSKNLSPSPQPRTSTPQLRTSIPQLKASTPQLRTSTPQLRTSTPQNIELQPVNSPSPKSDTSNIPKDQSTSKESSPKRERSGSPIPSAPAQSSQRSSPVKESRPPTTSTNVSDHEQYSYHSGIDRDQHSKSYSDTRNRRPSYDYDHRPYDHRSEHSYDRYPEHSRQKYHDKYSSFEDRAYSDRNGSRPSSRMSLDEQADSHASREHRQRKSYGSEYDRPPSRMSESEAYRKDGTHGYFDPHYPSVRGAYSREEEEYYQKMRNYRGYDYDQYHAASNRHNYYNYYDPYQYNYSSYNYGFYDELYRNDPRYKQRVDEQYREYYRRMGYDVEYERSSIQSGRSSANDLSKDTASQRYTDQDESSSDIRFNQSYDQRSQLSSLDISEDHRSTPAARLTPSKFNCPHAIAKFSNSGQLITIIPRQSAPGLPPSIEIHDMQVLTQNLESHEELRKFQEPLVRGETHKNDIIDFCMQKVKFYKQKEGIPDRKSYVLLWELLILLLRQNGSVVGSDIAELLLQDHEVLQPLSRLRNATYVPQGDNSPAESNEGHPAHSQTGDASSPDEGIGDTRFKAITSTAQNVDVEKTARKFREFLLFGHKKDALEWAKDHDLWGHALFLASKMDIRTYANVMTSFANSLALNDPLQTLYQLMSGRQPAAVTGIADKQWGDWRPHLAMVLSNPSSYHEVDSKSITTLGDTLALKGCLPAAHFCYLMAQVEFGSFSCKSSKIVLLCGDHQLPFEAFATNEAIQCTEIYEYAQSLANPGFMLSHFQEYKFTYAKRLVDHGFLPEALHYCEVLTSNFISNPAAFSVNLVKQVHDLACKLKYHDPHYLHGQGELRDQNDPEWLQALGALLSQIEDGKFVASSPYGSLHEASPQAEHYSQEFNTATHDLSKSESLNDGLYTQQNQPNMWATDNIQQQQQLQQSQVKQYEPTAQPYDFNQYQNQSVYTQQWNTNVQQSQEAYQYEIPKVDPVDEAPQSSPTQTSTAQRFSYYGSDPQMPMHNVQPRERTISNSSSGFQRDRRDSVLSSGSDYGNTRAVSPSNQNTASENRISDAKTAKSRPQVGRSWLGGIFSKFLPMLPNQMILPDDKNPAIVWDPVKNRWINTDSNEEDEAAGPAAPPKDTELTGGKGPSDAGSVSSMPPSTPIANKFQRTKFKGMRQNYVDINNPNTSASKSQITPDGMFPLMTLPQSNATLFTPTATVTEDDQPIDFVSTQGNSFGALQDQSEDNIPQAPPMFDPAEFDSRRSGMASIRHSVGPAKRAYPT